MDIQLGSSEVNFCNLFDSIEDMVFIAAPDGRIIYVNKAVLSKLGYSIEELNNMHVLELHLPEQRDTAQYIYEEMLAGRTTACQLPIQNRHGEVIPVETLGWLGTWNSVPCVFALIKDLTRRIEAEQKLKRLRTTQALLMELATQFINLPLGQIETGIRSSLAKMGDFVSADRVYVFDYDFEKQLTSNTFEWCAIGVEPQIENLQDIPLDAINGWLEEHLKGLEILIERIEEYKDNEARAILEAQGIKSLLAVPMMLGKQCLGFVGFDSVHNYHVYTEDEIKLLKLYAQMLANIRHRESQEIHLNDVLEDKILLMKEIHHRVKNNLQIVSSLLFLQSHFSDDPGTRKALSESENRIRAMALLHENIYQATDLVNFSFRTYVESIIQQIISNYQATSKIILKTEIEAVHVAPERAILCGLLINELLVNAMKHAFTGLEEGCICISLRQNSNSQYDLTISDDGAGFDYDMSTQKKNTIGLQLVDNLAKQLRGSINRKSKLGQGTVFSIQFPILEE